MIKKSRPLGLLLLLLIYIAAAAAGLFVFSFLGGNGKSAGGFFGHLLLADVAATIVVWAAGLCVGNASVYDPYWSVAPVVILPLASLFFGRMNAGILIVNAAVLIWGVRLTVHWYFTFKNLSDQDWRYTQLKNGNPRLYFLVNLFGINLFPTMVVFAALVPALVFVAHGGGLHPAVLTGGCLCVFAAGLQTVADGQLKRFRQCPENRGRIIEDGVWRYVRHPNYLGEILMWWGVFCFSFAVRPAVWMTGAGALLNTLLFVFVSVPLMENRQLRSKPEYTDYRAKTGMLLPKVGALRGNTR